jgi:hypothetical protein
VEGGAKPTKDEAARRLAELHYEIEPYLTYIHRLVAPPEAEARAEEPVKLLEVSESTTPSGITPLGFPPYPDDDIHHAAVIVEVTPGEFEQVIAGRLPLPDRWVVGEHLPRTAKAEVA